MAKAAPQETDDITVLHRKTDGLIAAIRTAAEVHNSHAEMIRQLREDLDRERSKTRSLEMQVEKLVLRLQGQAPI
jgi:hypothetical protein